MLHALAALLTLQLLGEMVVRALAWPVPGPVLGMALLWLLLLLRPRWLPVFKSTAAGLLQHLSLLFVPAGVGIMLHLQRLGNEAWAIGVALLVSTWIGLIATAWTTMWLLRRGQAASPAHETTLHQID
ncbi:MAG: CidA/LrgA family protein [Macromonas sp.]